MGTELWILWGLLGAILVARLIALIVLKHKATRLRNDTIERETSGHLANTFQLAALAAIVLGTLIGTGVID